MRLFSHVFSRAPWRWLLLAALVVLFALVGAFFFGAVPSTGVQIAAQPSSVATSLARATGIPTITLTQTATRVLTVSPLLAPTIAITPTSSATAKPSPTPSAIVSATIAPTPTIVSTPTLPAAIVLEGITIPARKAAFLRNKDVWVAEGGRSEQAVTTFGDVEAIFGWNKDATLLLFGRGSKSQATDIGATTELWLFNAATKVSRQITSGSNVHSAAWSPVDDRFAYCEQGMALTVSDTNGKVLSRLSNAVCFFSWSADGSNIAIVTATPESIAETNVEIYDFLTIWQLTSGHTLQIKTGRGLVYDPIWSMDSHTVVFQLATTGVPQSVWHVADATTGSTQQLMGTPKIIADFVGRSPGADVLIFRVDQTIYAMDFAGKLQTVDSGKSPTWLPNGKTIIYRDATGKLKLMTRDLVAAVHQSTGGGHSAWGLYSPPDYFLTD